MARCRFPGTLGPRACYGDVYHVFWILQMTVLLLIPKSVNSNNEDRCDTIVWDHGNSDVGVHDVTGSCTEGRVDWQNPYGAIRVMLQLRPLRLQKHVVPVAFESCFTVSAQHTSVKIYLDDVKSDELFDLATLNSSHTRMPKELCFVSEGDPVVVYIESELDGYSAAFGSLQLDYDNRRLPVASSDSQRDECRPCTDEEILESVCTNDFVVTGNIKDVKHDHELQQSHLHISVNQVFRQRHALFRDNRQTESNTARRRKFPRLNFHTDHGVIKWPVSEAEDSVSNESSQSEGIIFAPYKCGIRKGVGEFLFMGRIRLKKPLLQCAPRLEDFNRIWDMAVKMEQNMCLTR